MGTVMGGGGGDSSEFFVGGMVCRFSRSKKSYFLQSYSDLALAVKKVDSATHGINLFIPKINLFKSVIIGFPNSYPLDRDLSNGWCYPAFKQLGPVF